MKIKNNKTLIILIALVLIVAFIPLTFLFNYTSFKADYKLDKKRSVSESVTKDFIIGINSDVKDINLSDDDRFKVIKSSVFNLGLYTKMKKELLVDRVIKKTKVKTIIIAEYNGWGIGKSDLKESNFDRSILKGIDQLYSKN